ncbi:hypothetical protein KC19_VG068200 [Ceratodon purpureus]|uniref:Secreted protein n=1 Tax=Ceratodon purpureus TaxID=3225 RepID=A0A8T0HNA7_CERPU|nr:hypothetical protein KC19_VG068200 [Ceratodon purpureus]
MLAVWQLSFFIHVCDVMWLSCLRGCGHAQGHYIECDLHLQNASTPGRMASTESQLLFTVMSTFQH